MKLASYLQAGQRRLGAVDGEDVVDLNRARASLAAASGSPVGQAVADATVPADVLDFLRLGPAAVEEAEAALAHALELGPEAAAQALLRAPLAAVELLPPVPEPPKIVCVARNFRAHAEEAGLEISEIPILFPRFAVGLVADRAPVVRPIVSEQLDWEGELAVVIGKGGKRVPRERAMDHVAGYSVFNDVTVRDYQFRTTQYTEGKNFEASGPFGPYLVLKDEVEDVNALRITTYVDDELVQDGETGDMIFDIPTIVSHISEFIPLEPGDVIPMGTPSGVGFKSKPPRFLRPGEVVKVEVSGIGSLSNPVVDEEERA
ncbi:MAG: fumarylacetoacetate hydrolase family protein [Actinobacteria bacterium]|nr:fumarylacetoacetate hydrolase family protein [Actinomycetota bacterium]